MKTCTKCGEEKPLEAFGKLTKSKDGLQSRCKDCKRIDGREWRAANRERVLEYGRKWRDANPNHKREWYQANKERASEYYQEYHAENRERINARSREWHANNRDQSMERNRAWRKANPERAKSIDQARRDRMVGLYGETPDHKRIAEQMELLANDPCLWCGTTEAEEWHWDHIVPLAKGGPHEWWNLAKSCQPCNLSKQDKIPPRVGLYDWKS